MDNQRAKSCAAWIQSLFPKMTVAQQVEWERILLDFSESAATTGTREYLELIDHNGFIDTHRLRAIINRIHRQATDPTCEERRKQLAAEQSARVKQMVRDDEERYERGERINKAIDSLSANELKDFRAAAMSRLPEASRAFFSKFHSKHPFLRELIYREMMGEASPVGAV